MKNKPALNWLIQGIGSAKAIIQFTEKDTEDLKKIWENTIDPHEKNLLKNTLNLLTSNGTAYLEVEQIEYYGDGVWKVKKPIN
jgi:hypothetical protein